MTRRGDFLCSEKSKELLLWYVRVQVNKKRHSIVFIRSKIYYRDSTLVYSLAHYLYKYGPLDNLSHLPPAPHPPLSPSLSPLSLLVTDISLNYIKQATLRGYRVMNVYPTFIRSINIFFIHSFHCSRMPNKSVETYLRVFAIF